MEQLQSDIAEFVFRQVAARQNKFWLGARRTQRLIESSRSPTLMILEKWEIPLDEKTRARLNGIATLVELLESFLLKGVRGDSHMGFWGLLSGRFPLHIHTDIPTPDEMLELQCQGERYVTYLNQPEDLNKPVGRFSGAYEFLMHDLEHAHKYFGDAELFRGQLNFFNLLKKSLPQLEPWRSDPLFEKDLNYLKSDMNSHPVHLFKYLKAIVLTAELRLGNEDQEKLDAFWSDVMNGWQSPEEIRFAALRINRPGLETAHDQVLVHEFFQSANALIDTDVQFC